MGIKHGINLRQDLVSCPASSLGTATQHGEYVPKSQFRHQGQVLIALLGAPQRDQVKQLSHSLRRPRWVLYELSSCGSRVRELPRVQSLSQWVPSLQVLIIIYCEKNFFDEARELQSMDTPVSI